MSLLLKHDWSDPSIEWQEHHLQMAIAQKLKRIEDSHKGRFTFAADMSGAAMKSKHVAASARLQGMRSGETDLRLFFDGSRFLMIELKTMDGVVSKKQEARHDLLRLMGFRVEVVWAACPAEAVEKVTALVALYLPDLAI